MKILFTKVKDIHIPLKTFFIRKNNKCMLGRWGSVKNSYNSSYYGYDCANEFNSIIITNKETK
jgi:hypothetical protein